jgi:type I restriction enzyme S subunit
MTPSIRIEDICNLINGGTWSEGEYADQGVPVVRVSDMKNGSIDTTNQKFLSEKNWEQYAQHELKQ